MVANLNLKDIIVEMYAMQLNMDWDELQESIGPEISLCARWFPKEGRALYKATRSDSGGSVTSRVAKLMFPLAFAEDFRKAMGFLRRRISSLNKHLDTVQIKMSSGEFRNIDFKKLPGRATTKFQKAWKGEDKKGVFRHGHDSDRVLCRENWFEHLKDIESGVVKAKGKMLHIHEIVTKLMDGGGYSYSDTLKPDEITLYNAQFQSHIDGIIQFADENGTELPPTIVVADVSGSMSGDPMAVAIGMAILCSTKGVAHPTWENIVLPFSSDPSLVKLQYPTTSREWDATKAYNQSRSLRGDKSIYSVLGDTFDPSQAGRELTPYEKVQVLLRMDWGMSTNFVGALDLLAMRAIQAGVKMPRVLVVSDMEFDESTATSQSSSAGGPLAGFDERMILPPDWITEAAGSSWGGTRFGNVQYRNTRTGKVTTRMPTDASKPLVKKINEVLAGQPCGSCEKVVFWNARSSCAHPCGADDTGLVQVSGFSSNMIKLFFQNGDLESPSDDPVGTSWDALRTTLDCEDYDRITAILNHLSPWSTDASSITLKSLRTGNFTEEQKVVLSQMPCTWRTVQVRELMAEADEVQSPVLAWQRHHDGGGAAKATSASADASAAVASVSQFATTSGATSKPRCVIHSKPIEGVRGCTSCTMLPPPPRTPVEGGGAGRLTDSTQANPRPISLSDRVDGLELNVFGMSSDLNNDCSLLNRLDELERRVFGEKNSTWDSINARVAHLEKTLCG